MTNSIDGSLLNDNFKFVKETQRARSCPIKVMYLSGAAEFLWSWKLPIPSRI